MESPSRECNSCHNRKALNGVEFKAQRDGEFTKTCTACLEKKKRINAAKKNKENEHQEMGRDRDSASEDGDVADFLNMSAVNLDTFLTTLMEADDEVSSFTAHVNVVRFQNPNLRAMADAVAKSIWECLHYRFHYHSSYRHKRTPSTHYMYHCAQMDTRQQDPRKTTREGAKNRDKGAMSSFACDGWLHIIVHDGSPVVEVRLKHKDKHVHYWCIDVPPNIKEFVWNNPLLSSDELWDAIIKKDPKPAYSRKAIYRLWHDQQSKQWKRDPDEVKSARILIEEASKDSSSLYTIDPILLPEEEGFTGLAFSLPEVLRQWGGQIREVSLDSTWNTNGSKFEVYALLGEIYGSGCPMGYLLLRSADGEPGGKEHYISSLLNYFNKEWGLKAVITLSDKDFSEINAFLREFPDAKHQLCFWHCLRAIKTPLSILRRRPKYYDVLEAYREFDYIDKDFIPVGQIKDSDANPSSQYPEANYVAQNAIPHVTVRLNGVLQTRAPEEVPHGRRLIVHLNGVVKSIVPIPENTAPDSELDEDDGNSDLISSVDKCIDRDANEADSEDGPSWMFNDDEEPLSKDPTYVFCPAPHRKQILHLFTKHFCQHPLFAEKDGNWDARQIRREAVYEMYHFCHVRGLREVWGYMWVCWYSPKMWKLWARSTSSYISRLRTTMNVEVFWRQLKHNYLHHFLCPRLDHLVWILIHKVTPTVLARIESLNDGHRLGRTKTLTTYQKYFKTNWKRLLRADKSDKVYNTCVEKWMCNCGRQKYDRHHLCKHLVQAVGMPSINFWMEIYRRRTVPIYRHPELVKECDKGGPNTYLEPEGNITDGDDHVWIGNKGELEGGSSWKSHLASKTRNGLGKRARDSDSDVTDTRAAQDTGVAAKRSKHDGSPRQKEVIDLTLSSSPPSAHTLDSDPIQTSSLVGYGSEDESEMDTLRDYLKERARIFREAAEIFEAQADNPSTDGRMWMKSVYDRNIGRDVRDLVQDIRRIEGSGRVRGKTWANPKSKKERREMGNTMGYQVRSG